MPQPLSENEVRRLYDRMAFSYDLWGDRTESIAHDEAVSLAGLTDGQTVLEVGVGTGRLLREITAVNPSGLNLGMDISRGMLTRARGKLRLGERVALQVAGARDLPYGDGSIDVLFSAYLLDILPADSYVAVLREWYRVVRDDGRLVLANMSRGRHWYNRFWGLLYNLHPKIMGGCRPVHISPYLKEGGWHQLARKEISQGTFPSEVVLAEKSS